MGSSRHYKDKSTVKIKEIKEVGEKGIFFFNIEPQPNKEPSFAYVETAVNLALQGKVDALVTAPISKEKWLKAGIKYMGHTPYLASTAGIKNHAMCFWSKNLKLVLFTSHIPLKEIFKHLKQEEIVNFLRFVDSELYRLFKKKFTLFISGLNPHAGEKGLLGSEEMDKIIPAIEILQSEMVISGPYPPDTIFLKAPDTKNAVVVSWYHDQGLIPFKLLNLHSGVNLTLGLPYIRTSPDHGTAFDIAGKGLANPASMKAAIRLAEHLVKMN